MTTPFRLLLPLLLTILSGPCLAQGAVGSPSFNASRLTATPSGAPNLRTLDSRLDVQLEDYCSNLSASAPNVTTCLQAAVNKAVATGRCLSIPPTPASAGYWSISSVITIGNGSIAGPSTTQGACIVGAGSAGLYGTRGSYFTWTGAAGGTMLAVNGPIENLRLRGLNLNGNNLASRVIQANAVRFSDLTEIYGSGFTGVGLGVYGIQSPQSPATTHSNNIMLSMSKLYFTTSQAGATALDFDGVMVDGNGNSQSNDTWLSSVSNSRFESTGANGTAIRLAFEDNLLFSQVHALANGSGGCGVKFDASTSGTGGNSFPTGNLFVKSALTNTCTVEDASHTIGVNNFVDFGTTDAEVIPTHAKLRGVTDQGVPFNGYGNPPFVTYTPTLTFNGGAIGTGYTVFGRYRKSGTFVTAYMTVTLGASGVTTAPSSIGVSLPVAVVSFAACSGVNNTQGKALTVKAQASGTTIWMYDATNPVANGNVLAITCTYESAS